LADISLPDARQLGDLRLGHPGAQSAIAERGPEFLAHTLRHPRRGLQPRCPTAELLGRFRWCLGGQYGRTAGPTAQCPCTFRHSAGFADMGRSAVVCSNSNSEMAAMLGWGVHDSSKTGIMLPCNIGTHDVAPPRFCRMD
jgi:hypothetical protein